MEAVLNSFKSSKAPGLDGLIVEVLRSSWEWVKEECLEVVHAFWSDGLLTTLAVRGVIRLIPKKGDLDFLTNWRPITMLSLIYKLTRKLIVARVKTLLEFLVDLQQIGFIRGCKILDNILAFKVGKDFVKAKKLLALVLKLDFLKA